MDGIVLIIGRLKVDAFDFLSHDFDELLHAFARLGGDLKILVVLADYFAEDSFHGDFPAVVQVDFVADDQHF